MILQVKHCFFCAFGWAKGQCYAVDDQPFFGWLLAKMLQTHVKTTLKSVNWCAYYLINMQISSIQFVIWSSAAVNIPSREYFHYFSLWQAGEDLFPADDKGMSIPGNTDLLQTWEVSLATVTVMPSVLSSHLHVVINFKLQTVSCLQSYLEGLTGTMMRC